MEIQRVITFANSRTSVNALSSTHKEAESKEKHAAAKEENKQEQTTNDDSNATFVIYA